LPLRFFKYFEKDNLSADASWSEAWTSDGDYTIKRIYLGRKDGEVMPASTFYFKVAEAVYTHDRVPAEILGPDILTSPVLDVPIKNGQRFEFTFVNKEGVTISVKLTLEVWV